MYRTSAEDETRSLIETTRNHSLEAWIGASELGLVPQGWVWIIKAGTGARGEGKRRRKRRRIKSPICVKAQVISLNSIILSIGHLSHFKPLVTHSGAPRENNLIIHLNSSHYTRLEWLISHCNTGFV